MWAAVHLQQTENVSSKASMVYPKRNKNATRHCVFFLALQEKVPSMKFTDPSSKWRTHCEYKKNLQKMQIIMKTQN
jgi:hypothetical protein